MLVFPVPLSPKSMILKVFFPIIELGTEVLINFRKKIIWRNKENDKYSVHLFKKSVANYKLFNQAQIIQDYLLNIEKMTGDFLFAFLNTNKRKKF